MLWPNSKFLSLELAWWSLLERLPAPSSHHGGFHMEEWPWWPGPLHWAWPAVFVGTIGLLIYLAARRR